MLVMFRNDIAMNIIDEKSPRKIFKILNFALKKCPEKNETNILSHFYLVFIIEVNRWVSVEHIVYQKG